MTKTGALRALKYTALTVVVLVASALIAAVAFVGTEPGRLWVADKGLEQAAKAGLDVQIDGLASPGLGHWRFDELVVKREGETLVRASDLNLVWSPRALLKKEVVIQRLTADQFHLYATTPQADEKPAPEEQAGGLPNLPPVTLDKLQIGEFAYHQPEGTEQTVPRFAIKASARLFGEDYPVKLDLAAQALGDATTELVIHTQALSQREVEIEGSLEEAAAGWVGRLLRLPADQALDADFQFTATQLPSAFRFAIDTLQVPMGPHQLNAAGLVQFEPEPLVVRLEEFVLEVDGARQTLQALYSPELLTLKAELQQLPLILAQNWLPELEGGSLSGEIEGEWRHSEDGRWPEAKGQLITNLTVAGQALHGEVAGEINNKLLELEKAYLRAGDAELRAEGLLDLAGERSRLHAQLTNFSTELLEPWPVPLPESLAVEAEQAVATLTGSLKNPQINIAAQAEGQYSGQAFALDVVADANKFAADIARLHVSSGASDVKAQGSINWSKKHANLAVTLAKVNEKLLRFLPEEARSNLPEGLRFTANGDAQVRGQLTRPDVVADLEVAGRYTVAEQTVPFDIAIDGAAQVGPPDALKLDIEQLQLDLFGERALAVAGQYSEEKMDLRVQMNRLPTRTLAALGGPTITGEAQADLTLQGSLQQPRLQGTFSYSDDIQTSLRGRTRTVPVSWTTRFDSSRDQLIAQMTFEQAGNNIGNVEVQLPIAPYASALSKRQPLPLRASVQGQVNLESSQLFLADNIHTLQGLISANLTLAGTLEEPLVDGELRWADGYYANAVVGTQLHDITLVLLGQGQEVNVAEANLGTQGGGTVTATGEIDWSRAGRLRDDAIKLLITARDAQLVERADVEGEVQGDLRVQGSFQDVWVRGTVYVSPLQINLDSAIKTSIPEIEVSEIDRSEPAEAGEDGTLMPTVHLDVIIKTEQQAYLRGRGLDTELSGTIRLAGTLSDPEYTGQFRTVRGRLEALGRTFKLDNGQVRFSNDVIGLNIPAVLTADYNGQEYTYTVLVSGTVDNPKLKLSSTPALPDDEILSHLIFGRPIEDLEALQAVQLANEVRKLQSGGGGGGFDPIGSARDLLGVDNLTVGSAGADGGTNIGVGKYVSEDVYIEVQRSIGAESGNNSGSAQAWHGSVEIELSPRWTLKGGTSETKSGRAQFGTQLLWSKDY